MQKERLMEKIENLKKDEMKIEIHSNKLKIGKDKNKDRQKYI